MGLPSSVYTDSSDPRVEPWRLSRLHSGLMWREVWVLLVYYGSGPQAHPTALPTDAIVHPRSPGFRCVPASCCLRICCHVALPWETGSRSRKISFLISAALGVSPAAQAGALPSASSSTSGGCLITRPLQGSLQQLFSHPSDTWAPANQARNLANHPVSSQAFTPFHFSSLNAGVVQASCRCKCFTLPTLG